MDTIPRGGITHQPQWTPQRIKALGMTTDVATAGSVLGIGRTLAYQLAQAGQFPVKVIKAGQLYRVPTYALLEALHTGATAQRPPDSDIGEVGMR